MTVVADEGLLLLEKRKKQWKEMAT